MGKLTGPGDPPGRPGPAGPAALAALAALGRDAVKPHTEAQLELGLSALRARLGAARTRRPPWLRASLAGVTVALVGIAGVWAVPALRRSRPATPPPVTVARIEGGSLLDGGYLSESGHAGIRLLFNEGSTFVLAPGTRGRLRELAREGARFAIEDGAASFEVTPSAARRWSVEAGPFLVTVKGTVFNVSWDPASERFELVLRRGHVVVSGPVAGGGIPLRAGQRLVILLPKAETFITEEPDEREASRQAAPAERPTPPPTSGTSTARHAAARPALTVANAPAASGLATDRPRWTKLLAAGRWDRILAEADREGTDSAIAGASSEDLLALAHAARYRLRVDLAGAALRAQRRRFPGSPRALDALFFLGRVEELSANGASRAIAFYDDYLARAPRGAYAAEALGRKMILTNDLAGPNRARPIADEYLLRFPAGSYAGSARVLSRGP